MTLALIGLIAIAVVAFAERSLQYLWFASAAFTLMVATLTLVLADLNRAVLLSSIISAAIVGASIVKYTHSGLKLIITDLPLLSAGTVPFFVVQYPRAVVYVLAGCVAVIMAAIATLRYAAGPPMSLDFRIVLLGLALLGSALSYRMSGAAASFRRIAAEPRCFLTSFVASLIDTLSWRQVAGFVLSDIAEEPLPLMAAVPPRTTSYPDIIVIQHESIFDPRVYGLPIERIVDGFLSPKDGVYGKLNVDIFGGGSWQSEFSLLTGLSSASFGPNSYFLFKRGVGRFHHSLPRSLAALGYKTLLTSSCRRNFLNYDDFYRSIGITDRIFTDDFPSHFDLARFEATNSDALFLDAALDAFASRIDVDPAPQFLYALTNFNHGPHTRRLIPPEKFVSERAFAAASLTDAEYAEYYVRLVETAATWQRLKCDLAARFPDRRMLIVHYGDHQPVMARRIEKKVRMPENTRRQFSTFYAIETLNMADDQMACGQSADLDIAFLGTVALKRAGLPLDAIFATRASLLDQCGDAYFASDSKEKRQFHRTLVDLGMIDCGPATV